MSRAVFLHGFGADCLSWVGSVAALSGTQCITPDLPGHGTALGAISDGTMEDLATGVLDSLAPGPPAWLVGHSLGGGVALWLAAHHPERWQGLILLAPLGLGKSVAYDLLDAYPRIEDKPAMQDFLESLVYDKSLIKGEFADYALGQLNEKGGREALAKVAQALPDGAETVQSLLPRIKAAGLDTSVFWGMADKVVTADPGRIREVGRFFEMPKIGHIVHVEAMREINRFLADKIGA